MHALIGHFARILPTMSGKQNFAWCQFDTRHLAGPIFHGHGSVPVSSRLSLCTQCSKVYFVGLIDGGVPRLR